MRVSLAIGVVLALASAASAQDGLRSASLPERPIATRPPGPEDRFRATPDTYRPHNRPERPRWHATGGWPYLWQPLPDQVRADREVPEGGHLQLRVAPADALVYIDGGFEGTAESVREPGVLLRAGSHRVRIEAAGFTSHTFDVRLDDGETVTQRVSLDRERPSAPEPSQTAPPQASAGPRVMYVIPRCYAGDKPPDASTRCDLTQLRTIR